MKLKKIILFVVMFSSFMGCVSVHKHKPGVIEKKHVKYGVELPSEAWKMRDFRNADLFFEHQETGAIIFLSSQCEDVKESPLEGLRAQLLIGFENVEIDKQDRLSLGEREALISEVRARIDGVPRFLKVMVLRKNRCVFDAVLSSEKNIAEVTKDFDQMIATFWAEADL